MKIFSGTSNLDFSIKVANHLNKDLSAVTFLDLRMVKLILLLKKM